MANLADLSDTLRYCQILMFAKCWQIVEGTFSAVSKPIFASEIEMLTYSPSQTQCFRKLSQYLRQSFEINMEIFLTNLPNYGQCVAFYNFNITTYNFNNVFSCFSQT